MALKRSPNVVFMVNNPSGPDEFTEALGKGRVMLGFVFGAGKRDGSVIRAISGLAGIATPFGEIDGRITPRLRRLVGILCQAGLKSKTSTDISDYLATHAALVAPLHVLITGLQYLCPGPIHSRSQAACRCPARDTRCASRNWVQNNPVRHEHSQDHSAFPFGRRFASLAFYQICRSRCWLARFPGA